MCHHGECPGLQYVYDDLNQLVRINDVAGGKTYTYTYDNRGNLRQKNEYALSTGELGTPTRTVDYGYGNADWQDQLTSYNGSAITYDAIGNPTIWYNGTQMTWQKGRQLTGINSSVSGTTVYTYDDSGLRTSKTMNGVRTEYYRSGSRLIGQKQGSNVMQLLYDANGLYGFLYNGTPHYYVYNGQGDVVRLISASGATEAMYTYDGLGQDSERHGRQRQHRLRCVAHRQCQPDPLPRLLLRRRNGILLSPIPLL